MSEKDIIEQKIRDLQAELQSTDYMVIKCSEAKLLDQGLPYEINELYSSRQAIRDEINELQKQLNNAE